MQVIAVLSEVIGEVYRPGTVRSLNFGIPLVTRGGASAATPLEQEYEN